MPNFFKRAGQRIKNDRDTFKNKPTKDKLIGLAAFGIRVATLSLAIAFAMGSSFLAGFGALLAAFVASDIVKWGSKKLQSPALKNEAPAAPSAAAEGAAPVLQSKPAAAEFKIASEKRGDVMTVKITVTPPKPPAAG